MKSFTPILFLIISIALFFVVVEPLRKSVSQLKTDITAYNIALGNSTYLQKTQDKLLEDYKNIKQEDKDRLERLLPNTVNNIKFILEVERLANQYSMPIKNIKFETPIVASVNTGLQNNTLIISSDSKFSKPYGNFSIEFSTEGNYNSFTLFLKDLEHNLRLVDIKDISFSVPPALAVGATIPPGYNPDIYNYALKVETYWLK